MGACRSEEDIFPASCLLLGIPMPCSRKVLPPHTTLSPLIQPWRHAGDKIFQKAWIVILCNCFHSHTSQENSIPLSAWFCIVQLDWLELSPLKEHANGTRHKDRMAVGQRIAHSVWRWVWMAVADNARSGRIQIKWKARMSNPVRAVSIV